MESWKGAQGQGPAIDLEFYVSTSKIDAYGFSASQEQYILRHHVKMQINKNTATSYALRC